MLTPIAALVVLTLPAATSAAQLDAVRDGGFENVAGVTARDGHGGSWAAAIHGTSDATFHIVEGGRSGSRCVQYLRTTAGSDNTHLDQIVATRPGTVYELRAWTRSDGHLRPVIAVATMQWQQLAFQSADPSTQWTEVRFAFRTGDDDAQVRFQWFAGADGRLYQGLAGSSWLDDVSIREITDPPKELLRAFDLGDPKTDQEVQVTAGKGGRIGAPLPLRPILCRDGVLVYEDGTEVALWGVNLQTALYWEYMNRMKPCGIPLEADSLKHIADQNLDEMSQLGVGVIRMHLCPSDFADAEGNLTDSIFLDLLDYTLAKCHEHGLYVYLTLVNEMGSYYVQDSFITPRERDVHWAGRKIWLVDDGYVRKTAHYIRTLLERRNRYTQRVYRDDPAIAVLEIMNEPGYVSYGEMTTNPHYQSLHDEFHSWLRERGLDSFPETHYSLFRYEHVKKYIATMYQTIRGTGAQQPVAWCLNWPRFITDHEDVFQAVADSPVEVVSFCLYPGQDDVPQPFWQHPVDLDGKNYLPLLRESWQQYDRLRWCLGKRFAGKAKTVYEFETFYNQTAYLYPAMAQLFRALGVQMAHMWTYSLTPTAERLGGSHHLNLYCTPRKAVSFMIAGQLFGGTPRYTPYNATADDNLVFDSAAVSFEHNISLLATDRLLMHSGPIAAWQPVAMASDVQRIVGCGSSPLVSYDGTGAYFVQLAEDRVDILIHPDAKFTRPHWEHPRGKPWQPTCALDRTTPHRFELHVPAWQNQIRVFRLEGDRWESVAVPEKNVPQFTVTPGRYRISRSEPTE